MKLRDFILSAIALFAVTSLNAQSQNDFSSYYKNLPINLQPVKAPVIPDYTVKLSDFGAVNDGVTKNTEAFAKAMAHLAQKGGGHLVVTEGIWYTGLSHLKAMSTFTLKEARSYSSRKTSPTIP